MAINSKDLIGGAYPSIEAIDPRVCLRIITGTRITGSIGAAPLRTVLDITTKGVMSFMGVGIFGGDVTSSLGTITRLIITVDGVVLCDDTFNLGVGSLAIVGGAHTFYAAGGYSTTTSGLPQKFNSLKVEMDTTGVTGNISLIGDLTV